MSEHIWGWLEMGAAPLVWMSARTWRSTTGIHAAAAQLALLVQQQRQVAPQARAGPRVLGRQNGRQPSARRQHGSAAERAASYLNQDHQCGLSTLQVIDESA
jgi:hypothetical protein